MYNLFFEKNVIKFLLKLEKKSSNRIFEKIELLKENPFPSDSKKIVNINDKVFRIKVGDYRILYRVNKNSEIIVFLIDKRIRAYKF